MKFYVNQNGWYQKTYEKIVIKVTRARQLGTLLSNSKIMNHQNGQLNGSCTKINEKMQSKLAVFEKEKLYLEMPMSVLRAVLDI